MKSVIRLFVVFGTLTPTLSQAACEYLAKGLELKMQSYRSFRENNQHHLNQLLTTEAACKGRSEQASVRTAQLTRGESCAVQRDMSTLNHEIASLGNHCESTFRSIKNLQLELESGFREAKADLDAAFADIQEDELFQKYCGDEIQVARTMVDAFIALEGRIVSVKTRATDGEQNFLRVKETASALAAQTGALATNCTSTEGLREAARGPAGASADGYAQGINGNNSSISGSTDPRDGKKR